MTPQPAGVRELPGVALVRPALPGELASVARAPLALSLRGERRLLADAATVRFAPRSGLRPELTGVAPVRLLAAEQQPAGEAPVRPRTAGARESAVVARVRSGRPCVGAIRVRPERSCVGAALVRSERSRKAGARR